MPLWGAWSEQWQLFDKVDLDGVNRVIRVHPEVTELDIRVDVYSSWVSWIALYDNLKYAPAIRFTGFDPIGGGKYTGDIYFLTNGWKLYVDLSRVRITGVLYSDDYESAYFTESGVVQFPVSVAALVNTVSLGEGVPTAVDNAQAVWALDKTTTLPVASFGSKINSLDTTPLPTYPISSTDKTDIAERVWNQPSDTVYDPGSLGEFFKMWMANKALTVAKFLALK